MMIEYCAGYKYQLREGYSVDTGIIGCPASAPLVSLSESGLLQIEKYFAWDGASGPTWDDKTNMRASLVHDALYYLMRAGGLPVKCRRIADRLLEQHMIEDGAPKWRAWYYELAVRCFGAGSVKLGNRREIRVAP